jgi:hypothetical protein
LGRIIRIVSYSCSILSGLENALLFISRSLDVLPIKNAANSGQYAAFFMHFWKVVVRTKVTNFPKVVYDTNNLPKY